MSRPAHAAAKRTHNAPAKPTAAQGLTVPRGSAVLIQYNAKNTDENAPAATTITGPSARVTTFGAYPLGNFLQRCQATDLTSLPLHAEFGAIGVVIVQQPPRFAAASANAQPVSPQLVARGILAPGAKSAIINSFKEAINDIMSGTNFQVYVYPTRDGTELPIAATNRRLQEPTQIEGSEHWVTFNTQMEPCLTGIALQSLLMSLSEQTIQAYSENDQQGISTDDQPGMSDLLSKIATYLEVNILGRSNRHQGAFARAYHLLQVLHTVLHEIQPGAQLSHTTPALPTYQQARQLWSKGGNASPKSASTQSYPSLEGLQPTHVKTVWHCRLVLANTENPQQAAAAARAARVANPKQALPSNHRSTLMGASAITLPEGAQWLVDYICRKTKKKLSKIINKGDGLFNSSVKIAFAVKMLFILLYNADNTTTLDNIFDRAYPNKTERNNKLWLWLRSTHLGNEVFLLDQVNDFVEQVKANQPVKANNKEIQCIVNGTSTLRKYILAEDTPECLNGFLEEMKVKTEADEETAVASNSFSTAEYLGC